MTWWITDKSLGNHGRPTTLKPFIDFCMLPFSDERDIFNGFWWLLSGDHSSLDWGFEGQMEGKRKKKRPQFWSSPHFYFIFMASPSAFVVFCICWEKGGEALKKLKTINNFWNVRLKMLIFLYQMLLLFKDAIQTRKSLTLYVRHTLYAHGHDWYCNPRGRRGRS